MARDTGTGCPTRGLAPAAPLGHGTGRDLGRAACFPRASLVLTLYRSTGRDREQGRGSPAGLPPLRGSVLVGCAAQFSHGGWDDPGPLPTKLNSVAEPHTSGCPEQAEDAGEACFTDVEATLGPWRPHGHFYAPPMQLRVGLGLRDDRWRKGRSTQPWAPGPVQLPGSFQLRPRAAVLVQTLGSRRPTPQSRAYVHRVGLLT